MSKGENTIMQNNLKRRGLSFLLILAMLFVSFAVMLPVATSADPAEFDDEGVQTLSSFNLQNDADTDLRFLFTICRLDYDEVGFVFSKSVAEPTTSTGYKVSVDTVYTTVMANGAPIEAPAGRYYVAVKMNDVPRSYFDGTLYVRPYVVDGGVTRYDDVAITTICKAAGHNSHTVDDLAHGMKSGTAAMNVVGTKIGHCSVCNLDGVTQYDATTSLEYKKWVG
ncbi:MAG: hypothetical protein J6X72_04620, partial [Clostridia bacterium]|nr:hypothetical protein [Clostridia bacterium]